MVVHGWRSLNGRSLHDGHYWGCGSLEVGLGHAASVMYGNVQLLGHLHYTTGPSGQPNPVEKG
jgi:hypothetical protein